MSPAQLRVFAFAFASAFFALSVCGCAAELHPFHDCDPQEVRCEGEVAVNCQVESANPFMERYVPMRSTCTAPETCRMVGGAPRCAVSDGVCSTSSSPRRCSGNDAIACLPTGADPSAGYEGVLERCTNGNVCVEADAQGFARCAESEL